MLLQNVSDPSDLSYASFETLLGLTVRWRIGGILSDWWDVKGGLGSFAGEMAFLCRLSNTSAPVQC